MYENVVGTKKVKTNANVIKIKNEIITRSYKAV